MELKVKRYYYIWVQRFEFKVILNYGGYELFVSFIVFFYEQVDIVIFQDFYMI